MILAVLKLFSNIQKRHILHVHIVQAVFKSESSQNIDSKTYELYKLDKGPSENVELELQDALRYYQQMQTIRKLEQAAMQLYMKQLIRGFLHLYSGQEACAVGVRAAMEPNDTTITSYRCHGWNYLMGETIHSILAELLGKATDFYFYKAGYLTGHQCLADPLTCLFIREPEGRKNQKTNQNHLPPQPNSKSYITILAWKGFTRKQGRSHGNSRGKGGSMHMFYKHFYGGNGIVAAHLPLGAGIAFAHKYNNNGAVSFTILGEGAFNQGQTHESFNIAKLNSLPVVFVVENNKYGMGTFMSRSSACTDYFQRAFYLPGMRVDGMDVLAVREAARFSRDYVLKNGPLVLELVTYRYFGHSMSDPGYSYRTKAEVKTVRETQDPLKKFENRIIKSELTTKTELQRIKAEVNTEVDVAAQQATKDPSPDVKELTADCYVQYSDVIRLPGFLTLSKHRHFGYYKAESAQ